MFARWIAIFYLLLSACSNKPAARKFTIGFSQCLGSDDWRKTMLTEMNRELSFHNNIVLLYRDAEASSQRQVGQIEDLIRQHIDLLIVTPNEAKPLTPIIEKVYDAGIPVVVVDRKIDSKKYTAFIGASNYEVGQDAGIYAASLLKGKGNILEMAGLPSGASPAIDRHKGFIDVISRYPGLKYIKKVDNARSEEETLKTENIDLLYAQNDPMALEAYNICKKLGLDNRVRIIGIDGLSTPGLGLDMVASKHISATMLYPTGGQEAIQTAVNILENRYYEKENRLSTTVIDSTNIRITKLQNEKVLAQQKDIDRRQKKIEEQEMIRRDQNRIILAISVSLGLALIMGAILFYYLRENKKINARLALQNGEISSQRNQLIELGKKAKEATDAKFNFFTNISHELRTPLTLILGPLEDALSSPKLHFSIKTQLEMVRKNAMRLLRLVNQLMDFRKIEEGKMKIRASENNIIEFVSEIAGAFSGMAAKKNIAYRIEAAEKDLKAWFDVNMLDKILFNILSNAFKYTNDHGAITVTVSADAGKKNAIITITDTGIGMTPETQEHAFDLFYQNNEGKYKGTGIGLALSKELITLHQGSIKIRSEKWKGATFEICLPLGRDHLQENELDKDPAPYELNYEDEKIYTSESEPFKQQTQEDSATIKPEQSVLIIEDNPEIRTFIRRHLSKSYEVIETENGNMGLNLAYEIVPDLIISDILLPGKDGMVITETLKNDIRTSHIPIIILTARGSMEQQIEGLKMNADAYIVKPFNIQYLEEQIRSLLKNRESLKGHYTSELANDSARNSASRKIDRKFVNEFTAIIENNIANEDFSVNDICTELGISRVQLYRKVKAVLGYNVNEYILEVRMQKAKYLLRNEMELSISEVAYKVGFSSAAYFSTVMKSKLGVTPTEYRTKIT
ncbi:MAG: substrate-binding domain-containing protein [Chitinophagaceae bacterium]|nr:substrate-binding domain-containing protein [Chitinophagaceae bacterium]